jgi:uncharacterized membrane protein
MSQNIENARCEITQKILPMSELVAVESIRKQVLDLIREEHPTIDVDGYIAASELNRYRYEYMRDLVEDEFGELSALEEEVLDSIEHQDFISKNGEEEIDDTPLTVGEQLADVIAEFGGSWRFIISFGLFIAIWVLANIMLFRTAFDPYPFILLNLLLSCLAAIQAPLIMMSQNRQESKDRIRSEATYQVSLKTELEIKSLNEKLDHVIQYQNQQMMESMEQQLLLMQQMHEKQDQQARLN